jgi:hypothetical protein
MSKTRKLAEPEKRSTSRKDRPSPVRVADGSYYIIDAADNRIDEREQVFGALAAMAGTRSGDFVIYLESQLTRIGDKRSPWHQNQANAGLAFVANQNPRNEREAMIASQIFMVHSAMMEHARRLALAETIAQMEYAERAMSRLSKLTLSLMEGLNKEQHGSTQRVVVEHVNVHSGGQAIVGAVNVEGG